MTAPEGVDLRGQGLGRRGHLPVRGESLGARHPGVAEPPDQLVPGQPAQGEDQERVAVELLAEQVVDGRDVLARVGRVGARAPGGQVPPPGGEQRQAGLPEDLLDVLRHLAGQQLGREQGLAREGPHQRVPVGRREPLDLDGDLVRLGPRPLHRRPDSPLLDLDRQHLASAGVRAASPQPRADVEALQHGDPPLGPPTGAELAALRLRLDPPLGRPRPRWREVSTEVVISPAHGPALPSRDPATSRTGR
jgi:hypothetical protein